MSQINYIACMSWEDRFIESVYKDFEEYSFKELTLLRFNDKKSLSNSTENYNLLMKFIEEKNINIKIVNLEFDNQINIYNEVNAFFSISIFELNYLNISTMPRHLIYICFDILNTLTINFEILYYIPNSYGSEIAKNPNSPQLLIKHSGIFEADKETLLIISAGLDKERIFQLYYYFEPYKTIILEEENNYSKISEKERLKFETDLHEINNLDILTIDSFKENGIFTYLETELLNEIKNYNTLLCTIGPKIASVELYKFNLKYPKTGLVYALSKEYSKDYSSGLNSNYTFLRKSNFFSIDKS